MARTPSLWKFREGWGDIINQEHSTKQTLIFELVPWNLKICGFLTFRLFEFCCHFSTFRTFRLLLPLFDFSDFSTFRVLLPLFDFSDFSTFRVLLPLFDFLTFRLFEFFSIVLTLDPECIRVVPQIVSLYIYIFIYLNSRNLATDMCSCFESCFLILFSLNMSCVKLMSIKTASGWGCFWIRSIRVYSYNSSATSLDYQLNILPPYSYDT